jgi:hypothetical protein
MKRIFLILALLPTLAFSQNTRWDYQATTVTGSGQQLPVLAIPFSVVSFYSCTSGVCTTPANTYNTASSVSACPTGAQVVLQQALACTGTADAQGSFGAWFQPGQYAYTLKLPYGGTSGPYNFTIGSGSSGSGINQLTGDVTAGPGTGSVASTLANTTVTAGAYTNSNITVDSKGRVTAAASGSAGSSPLTTKGDIFGFSTLNARVPVGADTQVLTADSTQPLGVKWAAGGGASFPSGNTGQILSNTTGSTTYAAQPQLVYQQSGDTIASLESNPQCATACRYRMYAPLAITTTHTLAAAVSLDMQVGSGFTISSGQTLTLSSSQILANSSLSQHFFGSGAVAGLSGPVPLEWRGVVGFTTKAAAAAGTDYTTQIQQTLNSITGGPGWAQLQGLCYNASSGLSITTSVVGIQGVQGRDTIPTYPGFGTCVSTLVSTSTSTTPILNLQGTSQSQTILWNTFKNFAIQRTAQCTTTTSTNCIGFRMQYAGGTVVENVASDDSLDDFYFNGTPFDGYGHFTNVTCQNGQSGPNSYTSGQTINCFDIDSDNSVAMNSTWFQNIVFSPEGTAATVATSIGASVHGTQVNDLNFYGFTVAGAAYGMTVNYTGSGASDSCADIHVNFPTFDAITVSAFKITGLTAPCIGSFIALGGYATGYVSGVPGQKIVDVEGSAGVQFQGIEIFGGAGSQIGVYANGATNLSLIGLKCQALYGVVGGGFGGTGTCIQLNNTTGSTVSGNTFSGNDNGTLPGTKLTAGLVLTSNSTGNSITGNVVNGYAATGYSFDGTSLANDVVANSCGANVTTCATGVPIGTAPSFMADVYSNGVLLTGSAGYPQVTSLISGTGGANSAGLEALAAGGTVPTFWLNIAGGQAAYTSNVYYNGTNWKYVTGTGAPGTYGASAVRLLNEAAGGGYQLSLIPYGTAGGSITTMDTTAVTQLSQYGTSGNCTWFNGQTGTVDTCNYALQANPSKTWKVDFLGNETANTLTLAGCGSGTYAKADGSGCGTPSGGGSSVGTAGQVQMVGSTSGSFAASAATDNGTNYTITEPVMVTGTTHGIIFPAGTAVAGAANTVVYTSDATNGYAEVNENNTGLARVCTAANGVCVAVHSDYAAIQSGLFATATVLGPVYFEPVQVALKSLIMRQSGTISCTVAPAVGFVDLGTSPTTTYGSISGTVAGVTGATSDGVYSFSGSVNMVAGHYYGFAFSAGTCVTAPTFDITAQVQ